MCFYECVINTTIDTTVACSVPQAEHVFFCVCEYTTFVTVFFFYIRFTNTLSLSKRRNIDRLYAAEFRLLQQ